MSKIEKLAVKMAKAELAATQARIDCDKAKRTYREELATKKDEIKGDTKSIVF